MSLLSLICIETLSIIIISFWVAAPGDGIAGGCFFGGGVEVGPSFGLRLAGHDIFEGTDGILVSSSIGRIVYTNIREAQQVPAGQIFDERLKVFICYCRGRAVCAKQLNEVEAGKVHFGFLYGGVDGAVGNGGVCTGDLSDDLRVYVCSEIGGGDDRHG